MEIKYNNEINYKKMMGEVLYFKNHQSSFVKNRRKKIKDYYNNYRIIIVCISLIFLLSSILNKDIIGIVFFILLPIFTLYFFNKSIDLLSGKESHKGKIIIDENGITDVSDITVTFPWDMVKYVVTTRNTLIIANDTQFVIYLRPNNKAVEVIKQYKSDVQIIKCK